MGGDVTNVFVSVHGFLQMQDAFQIAFGPCFVAVDHCSCLASDAPVLLPVVTAVVATVPQHVL